MIHIISIVLTDLTAEVVRLAGETQESHLLIKDSGKMYNWAEKASGFVSPSETFLNTIFFCILQLVPLSDYYWGKN